MKWLSIDTDIAQDDKIQFLINEHGPEGYGIWNLALTKVAKEIDIDNQKNGYLTAPGDRKPAEFLSLSLDVEVGKIKKVFGTCSEFNLIDQNEWEENKNVYFPKLLERKQVKKYLQKQRSGRKGGKKGKPSKRTKSETEANTKRNGSGSEANSKRTGTDKTRDKTRLEKQSKESSDSDKTNSSKAKMMEKVRKHLNRGSGYFGDDWKNDAAEKVFGRLIFKSGFVDDELEWIMENKYKYLLSELKKAPQGKVFAYFKQSLKTITSEVKEQRLYDRQKSGTNELDQIIEEAF